MFSFRLRVAVIIGGALLGVGVLPATAAMASGSKCSGNAGVSTCTHVKGTGLYVSYVNGQAYNGYGTKTGPVHIEIEGPAGRLLNCSAHLLAPGTYGPVCTWTRNGNVQAGNYCSTAWEETRPGYYVKDATACVSVHS
jgi:hypothetical protein